MFAGLDAYDFGMLFVGAPEVDSKLNWFMIDRDVDPRTLKRYKRRGDDAYFLGAGCRRGHLHMYLNGTVRRSRDHACLACCLRA